MPSVRVEQGWRRGRIAKRIVAAATTAVLITSGLTLGAQPANAVTCGMRFALLSTDLQRYVSVELGNINDRYGELRARATDVGPWEIFRWCYISHDSRTGEDINALKSEANNRYVSVEFFYGGDYNRMLRARATAIGPWERLTIHEFSNDIIGIRSSSDQWVSADQDYPGDDSGMLIANRLYHGPWESFYVQPLG